MRNLGNLFLATLAFLIVPFAVKAQNPPEGTYIIGAGAGYTTVSGPLDNGSIETVQYHINDYFSARLDAFTFGGGFLASTGRVQAQAALSHLFKGNEYLDTSRILPFVNAGGGVVKNSNGDTRPGFDLGAGFDYKINNTLTIRAIDFTYLRSTIIPGNGTTLTNFRSVATGIFLTFPTNPTPAQLRKRADRLTAKEAKRKAKAEATLKGK